MQDSEKQALIQPKAQKKQAVEACFLPENCEFSTYGSCIASSEKAESLSAETDAFLPPTGGSKGGSHYPFLDITRICCVWCVAIDHGNYSFGVWNVMFTQDWVLQYLFLLAGVAFAKTTKGLLAYQARLAAYFLAGVLVNLLAWIICRLDWRRNIFNVIFHLWFVVGYIIYCAMLAPLKAYLIMIRRRCEEEGASSAGAAGPAAAAAAPAPAPPDGGGGDPELDRPPEEVSRDAAKEPNGAQSVADAAETQPMGYRDGLLKLFVVIGGGMVAVGLFFTVVMDPVIERLVPGTGHFWRRFGEGADFWGMPQDEEQARIFLQRYSRYLMASFGNLYLIAIAPLILPKVAYTTWLVVLNTYVHRMFVYRAQDERFLHGLDLMMIGFSCYFHGMRHRRLIGKYMVRYWFVLLLVCALVWPPGTNIRLDEHPPVEESLRIRVNLLEGIFVVIWLCAGERLVQPEIFTQDGLGFLNRWSLVLFLVHKAVHMTLSPPLNWTALVALAPLCYF